MGMTSTIKPTIGCGAVAEILGRVGDRWTMQVVVALRPHPRRFNEVKRNVPGISQQMLTRVLKSLERDGLVVREVKLTAPPQVSYELTDLGHSLADTVRKLADWAVVNLEAVHANQARYDAATQLGEAKKG